MAHILVNDLTEDDAQTNFINSMIEQVARGFSMGTREPLNRLGLYYREIKAGLIEVVYIMPWPFDDMNYPLEESIGYIYCYKPKGAKEFEFETGFVPALPYKPL